jgi:hypothetical protein
MMMMTITYDQRPELTGLVKQAEQVTTLLTCIPEESAEIWLCTATIFFLQSAHANGGRVP